MLRAYLVLLAIVSCAVPSFAYALLPPDIIFNVGYQFVHFFSFLVLIVGGLIGSTFIFLRPYISFIHRHMYAIMGILFSITASSILGIFLLQERANNTAYLEQIGKLREQLEQATRVTSTVSKSPYAFATYSDSDTSWNNQGNERKIFLSDTLYLYGNDAGTPFYLEIDLNRRQVPNGTFMHYYYIIGAYDNLDKSEYTLIYSTSTVPIVTKSIKNLTRLPFSDLSTRQEYRGIIDFGDTPITYTLSNLQGDFITRNSPAYTRHQSVGDGVVLYNNKNISVHTLVESIHSSDFSKQIFFKGSNEITATTRQFVLWDSEGSFYMIDQSDVASEVPEYPSHTWLLYKNGKDGFTKKGFTSDIYVRSALGGSESSWSITAHDFSNANIELSLVKYIEDGDSQTRLRALVKGVVTDSLGKREINGFAIIIK